MRPIRALAVAVVFIALAATAMATVYYVDDDAPPGGDGLSWSTAFRYLQDALPMPLPGEEIHVAQGTYHPDRDAAHPTGTGDRMASFRPVDDIAVMGGYAGLGAPVPDERDIAVYETILSGDIGIPDDNADNSYHVVDGGGTVPTALLDGFTITAGNADTCAPDGGGGVYCYWSSPTLANCTITGNSTSTNGGGVYCTFNSGPVFANCSIAGNTAGTGGGGVYCDSCSPTLAGCTIADNIVTGYGNGGGVYCFNYSSPTLTGCTITANAADGGSGVYCGSNSSPTLTGCTITANIADYLGGGVCCSQCSAVLTDCTIAGNTRRGVVLYSGSDLILSNCTLTDNSDGGMRCDHSSPTLANCMITNNLGVGVSCTSSSDAILAHCAITGNTGGGMFCDLSDPTLANCTIAGNGGSGGGVYCWGSDPTLTNCMIAGNTSVGPGGGVYAYHSSPTLTNCTIASNVAGDQGGGVYSVYYAYPVLANSIIWANSPQAIFVQSGYASAAYCDVQGGWSGAGNIDADPLFVRSPYPGADGVWGTPDDDFGDLRLTHGSPCIDSGNNAAVPTSVTTDLDGNPRFIDVACRPDTGSGTSPVVDLGAYEALDDVLVDCNANDVDDLCETLGGTSPDVNGDGIPDECQDCNANGVPDPVDLASGTSMDCNRNFVPDECDIGTGVSADCNASGIPDECELRAALLFTLDEDPGWTTEGLWAFGQSTGAGSHNHDPIAGHTGSNVYGYNLDGDYANNMPTHRLITSPIYCAGMRDVELRFWRWLGVEDGTADWARVLISTDHAQWTTLWGNYDSAIEDAAWVRQSLDLSTVADNQPAVYICWSMGPTNHTVTYPGWNIDDVEIAFTRDCNANNLLDECDILSGTSADCNADGIPDECQLASNDCNQNAVPDDCDLFSGVSADCNANSVPDECDIASAISLDCDGTGVPDECEYQPDCNGNGISDACELGTPGHIDCNNNGVLDECDVAWGPSLDCNGNGLPDECDIADGSSADCNVNTVPDECDIADGTSSDVNANGIPDECEACHGDLNCDAVVDFLDINAFVLYLSNFPVWQTTYVGCDAANGDLDGNGVYPAFADINAFVTLLTTHSLPLPCGRH